MKKIRSFDDIPESPLKNMVRILLDEATARGIAGASALYKDMVREYKLTRGESAALSSYFQIAYAALPSSVALKAKRLINPASPRFLHRDEVMTTIENNRIAALYPRKLEIVDKNGVHYAISSDTTKLLQGLIAAGKLVLPMGKSQPVAVSEEDEIEYLRRRNPIIVPDEIANYFLTKDAKKFVTAIYDGDILRTWSPVPHRIKVYIKKHGLTNGRVVKITREQALWRPIDTMEFSAGTRYSPRQNPVPLSISAQKKKAQLLYSDFTGHEAGDVEYIDKPVFPDAVSVIGDIDGVMYTTVRDGKTEKYIHEFKKNSRPLFCVSPDGLTLYMIGGSYQFGERGIIDK